MKKTDIVWYNSQTGEIQIWFMNENRIASRGTVVDENGSFIPIGPPFIIVGVGDINGNGKADIVWYNSQTGETQIWFMNENRIASWGTVVDENGNFIPIGPPFSIVGVGDMNGNGKADIVWYNSQTGETQIWFMNENRIASRGTVVDESGSFIPIGPPFSIVGVGDMNGNGKADIVWYNSQTGETQIWFMNENRVASRGTVVDENGNFIPIGPPFSIVGVGDMNGNGKADIVWYNSQTGETQIWFMNENRIASRGTVVDENGNFIPIGPPFSIVGVGEFINDEGDRSMSTHLAGFEIFGAIEQKWLAAGGQFGLLGLPTSNEMPTFDGVGRFQWFTGGTVSWHPQIGAFMVYGLIGIRWHEIGKEQFGYPITDELGTPDGVGRYNHFRAMHEPGTPEKSIYWHPDTGAHEVYGQIRGHWAAMGWELSALGYPNSHEVPTFDGVGRVQTFTGGTMSWHPETGAHAVWGLVSARWWELGREQFGYPITDELGTPDGVGRYNHFRAMHEPGTPEKSIYWHPDTGAHEVYGQIRGKWAELGWETGALGYPNSHEVPTFDGVGRVQTFTGGTMSWHPETGAHAVWGLISARWWELGREQFGYPITDELGTPDGVGRYNHFRAMHEPGTPEKSIYWHPDTGAHEVYGAIRGHWAAMGGAERPRLSGRGGTRPAWRRAHPGFPVRFDRLDPRTRGIRRMGPHAPHHRHASRNRARRLGRAGDQVERNLQFPRTYARQRVRFVQVPSPRGGFLHSGSCARGTEDRRCRRNARRRPRSEARFRVGRARLQRLVAVGMERRRIRDLQRRQIIRGHGRSRRVGSCCDRHPLLRDSGRRPGAAGRADHLDRQRADGSERLRHLRGGGIPGALLVAGSSWLIGPSFAIPIFVGTLAVTEMVVESRRMTQPEYDFAKVVFGDTLPPIERILLTNLSGAGGRAFVAPNADDIVLVNITDTVYSNPQGPMRAMSGRYTVPGQLLIHELTHAWQLARDSFVPGYVCRGATSSEYTPPTAGSPWGDFNIEQQATAVDQWFGRFATGWTNAADLRTRIDGDAAIRDPYFQYIFNNIRAAEAEAQARKKKSGQAD